MAVEAMKLLTIAAPLERLDDVDASYVVDQEIHLEPALQIMKENEELRPLAVNGPYAVPLRQAENLAGQLSIPLSKSKDTTEWEVATATAYLNDLESRIQVYSDHLDTLNEEINHCQKVKEDMVRLKGLSTSLNGLWDMSYTRFRFGYLPRNGYENFQEALSQREDVFYLPTSEEEDRIYGVYLTSVEAASEVDELLASLHFTRVWINATPTGTPQETIREMDAKIAEAQKQISEIDEQFVALGTTEKEKLLSVYTWLRYHKSCQDVRQYACCSKDAVYLTGWVPETELPALTAKLQADPDIPYVLDDGSDPELEITPPTKLKSSFMGRIFKPFLELYGLPAYNEVDPSIFMALTYCLFFGIMFGDLGQGLGVALVGALLWKFKKIWLGKIIACCGLSGAVFGCVYGSVFGFEDILPGFKILEGDHVMTILVLSVAVGILNIFLAMGINVINGIKQHNFEKILFGPNGVVGAVFYGGLILLLVATATGMADLLHATYVVPVLILPIVLMLLKEPLSKLVARDPSWREIKLGEVLGLGIFEMIETLLSYVTNTISFLRVGAYAIIHVGLMLVVHMMAGSGNILVLVLGNLFVMGFEGFLVGIQVLRLEFYELFSRFYGNGGIAYTPHIIDYTIRSTH